MKRTVEQIRKKAKELKNVLKKKKICENFGDKEIKMLKDYIGIYGYDWVTRQEIYKILDDFVEWCSNYNNKQ